MKTPFWTSCLFIILFLGNGQILVAQNLIPDPGFEIWNGTVSPSSNTLGSLTHWFNVNGTADHHHQQNPPGSNLTSLENCPTGQGQQQCGQPHEGEGVLGCLKANGFDGSREWAGTQLTQPLIQGDCYKISFWIQNKKDKVGEEYVTNQWGVFFNDAQLPFFTPNIATYSTMADHWLASDIVVDGSDWKKIEFDYQASEDFEYLYVGFMGDFSTSTFSVFNDNYLLGCYVWIDEIIVTRVDPPQLDLTDDISICEGENVILEAVSNYPILWEDNNSSDTSRSISPIGTTIYYVQTLDSTLCSIRDSIEVTIVGDEVIDFMGVSICAGADPLILDSNVGAGNWSGIGIIDGSQGLFDPTLSGVGEFLINYISDADCSEDFTMMVEVYSSPEIDLEVDFLEGCPPLEVQFSDLSPTSGISYEWDFGNGSNSIDLLNTSTVYPSTGNYDLNVEVVYSDNCKSNLNFPNLIEVFESPKANFSYAPSTPSNLNPTVEFENTSTGNITEVFWDFGNGITTDSYNPQTTFNLPGIYDVQLQVGSNGCVDSITQMITVNSEIKWYIPNAFSPNGDGANDLFEVFSVGSITAYEIIIFDRWGSTLFKSNNIEDSWDGRLPNGKTCNSGIFIYYIKYSYQGLGDGLFIDGQEVGDITILR